MDSIIKKYSKAALELCVEDDSLEKAYEQAKDIFKMISSSKEWIDFLQNPNITKEEKVAMIIDTDMVKELQGLFYLLVDNNLTAEIENVLNDFILEAEKSLNIVNCLVVSAVPLDDVQTNNLKEALTDKFSEKVNIQNQIDSSLVAGMVMYINGKLIDLSVKGKLDNVLNEIN